MGIPYRYSDSLSFFEAAPNAEGAYLSSRQIDPSQPSVVGIDTITDPLVPTRTVASQLRNFDPEIFDLRDSSHLMRLLRALMGAPGVEGYRRSLTINRMGGALATTHFADLDSFWGGLFGAPRRSAERLPEGLDPSSTVADSATWDAAHSRDAAYRNRLYQLAKGFTHGGTVMGMEMAAEALLDCEVDILETWVLADLVTTAIAASTTAYGDTWDQVVSEDPLWSNVGGHTYSELQAGVSQLAIIDRSEIVITPHREISENDRRYALDVLELLKPAGTVVTLNSGEGTGLTQVVPSAYWADSEDWDIVTTVTSANSLVAPDGTVYASADGQEAGRPAFGRYLGEEWSYNTRISAVSAYAMVDGDKVPGVDYQAITYADGTSHDYRPAEALLDQREAMFARLASEGVQTTYPYSVQR